MRSLQEILHESSLRHRHVCPRQVLGARMGLFAAELLNLNLPRADKRLLVISETDGCTVDGLIAATGCHVGGRTLHILDFGKVAATFVDTCTGTSLRLAPAPSARTLALDYAPNARNRWEAMLHAYQIIPAKELFSLQQVQLTSTFVKFISGPNKKALCKICKEEIINGRELIRDGLTLCQSCAGNSYYADTSPRKLPTEISLKF